MTAGPPSLKGAFEQRLKWGTSCGEAALMSLDDFCSSETKRARSSCPRQAPMGSVNQCMSSKGKDLGKPHTSCNQEKISVGQGAVARAPSFPNSAPSSRLGPPVFPSADPSPGWKGDSP